MIEALWYHLALVGSPLSLMAFVALTVWLLWRGRKQWPLALVLGAALAAYPMALAWLAYRVLQGEASTSAIGLIYVPFYAGLWAVALGLVVWALVSLARRPHGGAGKTWMALAVLVAAALAFTHRWYSTGLDRRAADRAASPEALRGLFAEHPKDRSVLLALAGNPNAPPQLLEDLARLEIRRLEEGTARLAALSSTAPEDVLRRLAQNPSTPPSVLERLAASPADLVAATVAGRPDTPPSALERLKDHSSVVVLRSLARNPQTQQATLGALARHPDRTVREGVAHNRSTPAAALTLLAADREPWVRQNVAFNPATPPPTLLELASDTVPEVRFRVAINPGAPREALEALARDQDEKVRRNAAQRLESTPGR